MWAGPDCYFERIPTEIDLWFNHKQPWSPTLSTVFLHNFSEPFRNSETSVLFWVGCYIKDFRIQLTECNVLKKQHAARFENHLSLYPLCSLFFNTIVLYIFHRAPVAPVFIPLHLQWGNPLWLLWEAEEWREEQQWLPGHQGWAEWLLQPEVSLLFPDLCSIHKTRPDSQRAKKKKATQVIKLFRDQIRVCVCLMIQLRYKQYTVCVVCF